jgi:hypothetical protein
LENKELASEGLSTIKDLLTGSNEVLNGKSPVAFLLVFVFGSLMLLIILFFVGFGFVSYNSILSEKELGGKIDVTNEKILKLEETIFKRCNSERGFK